MIYLIHQMKEGDPMDAERINHIISVVCCCFGFALMFFTAGLYFFLRETWQIIAAFAGIGFMLFGLYAEN